MSRLERDVTFFLIKSAEKAERYDDMIEFVEKMLSIDTKLNVEERNLMSVAYTNSIRKKRRQWQAISQSKDSGTISSSQRSLLVQYCTTIEVEIEKTVNRVLKLVKNELLPDAIESEARVFYYKMIGDYHRYLAELREPGSTEFNTVSKSATTAYMSAMECALRELLPTNSIRLGLVLNYSSFLYKCAKKPLESIKIAKEAYEDAIVELGDLTENDEEFSNDLHDASLILKLINDKLISWKSEQELLCGYREDSPARTKMKNMNDDDDDELDIDIEGM
jgi:14-3-3 protein epsilon